MKDKNHLFIPLDKEKNLKKYNILSRQKSHDPAIPLLSIYPKEMKPGYWKGMCIPYLLDPYLKKSRYGDSLNVHQQMNG